jgi:hypothetical protein
MDGQVLRRRMGRMARDWSTTLASLREPVYRRLSRGYRLPEGIERVYCHHLRKTGGTSLHLSFLSLGGEDPEEVHRRLEESPLHRTTSGSYGFVAHQRRLIDQGHYLYAWSHLPARRLRLRPRTFTVTILRDPVDRVVSYYGYLREGDGPEMAFPVPDSERALAAEGFSAFVERLPREQLLGQLFMFSRTLDVREALDELSRCSLVMFTDELEAGVSELSRRLDLPLQVHRARRTRSRPEVTDEERRHLHELLAPEYELIRRLKTPRGRAVSSS